MAQPHDPALKLHLIQTQRHLVAVMAYFHLYQSSNGDKQYTRALTDHLLACKERLEQLRGDLKHKGLEAESSNMQSQWNFMAQSLNSSMASLKRGGFLEQTVDARYRESAKSLYTSLVQLNSTLFPQSASQAMPGWEQLARLSLLMQQMSLRYLDDSWIQSGVRADLTLEQMALLFDRQLQQLEHAPHSDEVTATLKDVRSKWNILGRTMVSDPDHPVPFLVTRYGDNIVEQLQRLIFIA